MWPGDQLFNEILEIVERTNQHLLSRIPNLSANWPEFEEEAVRFTAEILYRLESPTRLAILAPEEALTFRAGQDGLTIARRPPLPGQLEDLVLPGCRRVLKLFAGHAIEIDGETVNLPAGRVVFRVEERRTVIKELSGGGRGREHELAPGDCAKLEGPLKYSELTCNCGTEQCETRHRLPDQLPLGATRKSFLATAVKGPMPGYPLGSFKSSMYFALLCQGV